MLVFRTIYVDPLRIVYFFLSAPDLDKETALINPPTFMHTQEMLMKWMREAINFVG